MKKAMLLSGALAVVGLTLVSCSSTPETTTTTTRQTTVQTAAPPPTRDAHDNNDTYGRRLLIDRAGRDCVCCRHGPLGLLRISKSSTEFDRPQAGGYSRYALRVFGRPLLCFGLPLPLPDSLRVRSPEAFRHCGDPSVSHRLCFVRPLEFPSRGSGRAGLCW